MLKHRRPIKETKRNQKKKKKEYLLNIFTLNRKFSAILTVAMVYNSIKTHYYNLYM